MKLLVSFAILLALNSACAIAGAPPESAEAVPLCEVEADPETYLGTTFDVVANIWNSHHGMYASERECKDSTIWFSISPEVERAEISAILAAMSHDTEEFTPDRYRVTAVLADYHLWGTDHVSKRFRLDILDVFSDDSETFNGAEHD